MPEYYKTLKLLDPKLDSKLSETIFNVEKLWLRWDSVLFAKLKKTDFMESKYFWSLTEFMHGYSWAFGNI